MLDTIEIYNNELILNEKSFLVSQTDEKGYIVFANDEFCTYSGYTIEELIGKPHNIVRHQDMPAKVFEELWSTVKSGKKWRGFVKNSRKDGNFYWVFATVFPFRASDNINGYISCRRKASIEEIEKYTKIYADMH